MITLPQTYTGKMIHMSMHQLCLHHIVRSGDEELLESAQLMWREWLAADFSVASLAALSECYSPGPVSQVPHRTHCFLNYVFTQCKNMPELVKGLESMLEVTQGTAKNLSSYRRRSLVYTISLYSSHWAT